jgi:acetylornithine/N-succinyldiaminopimelate aminotransferase
MYYYATLFFWYFPGATMDLAGREEATLFHTYKRLPLEIDHGEGMYLVARDGRKYLDMFSGLAVNALGYAHPRVTKAIVDQANRYTHLSNYFLQEPQIRLAELLTKHSGFPRVFFCNSGTEAIEGAMKLVRQWGNPRGKTGIVAFSNAFHGRTMGALSLMDRPKYREGFGPFLDHCTVATFNDPSSLTAAVRSDTAAVLLEFIQGEGGVRPVSMEFAQHIKSLRAQHGFQVIADEIQSGMGRTGAFFAFQHYGIEPDVATLAKPIGGGLPLGAILAREGIASVLQPGMHGTTFGGNPVACAAGVAVIEEIMAKGLITRAADLGKQLLDGLRTLAAKYRTIVREVRGFGLMAGMDLVMEGEPIVVSMREKGILINCTDTTVLRFLPPLIVGKDQIDQTLSSLDACLAAV